MSGSLSCRISVCISHGGWYVYLPFCKTRKVFLLYRTVLGEKDVWIIYFSNIVLCLLH
jgi:hypothetical protein